MSDNLLGCHSEGEDCEPGLEGELAGGGGGGEGGGEPHPGRPRHAHAHLARPPVELQHLRGALETEAALHPLHLPHVLLLDGEVERDGHELSQGVVGSALIARYVGVDVPGEAVLAGGVGGVRGVAVDVPGEDGGRVGLRQHAVGQQGVAQQVLGAHAEYLGPGVWQV